VPVILQMYAERPVQNRRRGDENRRVEDERGGITSIQTRGTDMAATSTVTSTSTPSRTIQLPPLLDTSRSKRSVATVTDAVKVYGRGDSEVRALDGVSVEFAAATFTAIMGPSGSGKSTLMHTVAGLDRLTSGTVLIGHTDISTLDDRKLTQLRRDRIGFIFQSFNLVPTLTAAENIALPAKLAGRTIDPEWFAHVIDTVGLDKRLKHRPSELSGGQQQRVAVARALASRPEIIFADEPTGNLDSLTGAEILSFMRTAVREMGQTIVMVTHDPVAASYADRALFLADGRIVDDLDQPTTDSVLDRIRHLGA
jgi:putative ABC transport system ATP-binding protein